MTLERHRAQQAFAGRLRTVFREFGRKRLTEEIPCSPGAVRKWLAGQSDPKRWYLARICEIAGCSLEWLVTGIGPKYPIETHDPRRSSYLLVHTHESAIPIRGITLSRSWLSANFGIRPGRIEAHSLRAVSQQILAIIATDQLGLRRGWFLAQVEGTVKLLHYDPSRADVLSEDNGQTAHPIAAATILGRAVVLLRAD